MASERIVVVSCVMAFAICSIAGLSCHIHNKAFQQANTVTYSKSWEVLIPVILPDSYYAVRISSDTTFTCFFGTADWHRVADEIIKDSLSASNYIYFIDSIYKADGIINTGYLPAKSARCAPVSPAGITWTTIDTLFTRGKLSVQYADGKFVPKLECKYEHSEIADRTYYSDTVTHRTFHSVGVTRQGGF
jgi:hypothetical protein